MRNWPWWKWLLFALAVWFGVWVAFLIGGFITGLAQNAQIY
jgi:hypothetical protein